MLQQLRTLQFSLTFTAYRKRIALLTFLTFAALC